MRRYDTLLGNVAKSPFPVRLIVFIAVLAATWTPLAVPIALLISDPTGRGTALLIAVLVAFLGVLIVWNRLLYRKPVGLAAYGLQRTRQNGKALLLGWAIGAVSLAILFGFEGLLGWLSWQFGAAITAGQLVRIVLEGMLVAIAVSFGEELLFRGWILNELDRDYHPVIGLWVSSVLYAGVHFIKPIDEVIRTSPQFPGLVLLGLILVWARRSQKGQLGLSIGLHAGLVWGYYLIQVGQLATISSTAPELWIGIDQNPLAGGLGLISLSMIAVWIRQFEFARIRLPILPNILK